MSDRVIIMYLGRVVEMAKTEELFGAPRHHIPRLYCKKSPVSIIGVLILQLLRVRSLRRLILLLVATFIRVAG